MGRTKIGIEGHTRKPCTINGRTGRDGKKMMQAGIGRRALCLVGLLTLVAAVRAEIPSERLESCRAYVADKWGKLCKVAGKASDLRDELPSLPASAWFSRDRKDQAEDIADLLDEARDLLLSASAKDILKQIHRLDGKIRDLGADLAEANRERVLNPGKREKYTKQIEDLTARRDALRREQAVLKRKVLDELRSWGLDVPEASMEPFFAAVTCDTIIENAIVAANVVAVVKSLEEMMQGDLDNARRYYGMYVVMLDLQLRCCERFIRECEGVWIARVDDVIGKVRSDRAFAERKTKATAVYSEAERQAFAHNVELNDVTLRAATAYRACLLRQRDAVAAKAARIGRTRDVAMNTYETISNAVNLRDVLRANAHAFEAVMRLDFPPLVSFGDEALAAEFRGITDRIVRESR